MCSHQDFSSNITSTALQVIPDAQLKILKHPPKAIIASIQLHFGIKTAQNKSVIK